MNTLRIVMVSQYGSGLANTKDQFSGALARQRDYAEASDIEMYHMVVPAVAGDEPIHVTDKLIIHPVTAKGNISFLIKARAKVRELDVTHDYTHCMVDNPHTAGMLGMLLKRDLNIPLVVHSMSDMIRNPWYRKERLSNRFKALLSEIVVRSADLIRVSTQAEIDRLQTASFAHKLHKVSFYVDQERVVHSLAQVDAVEVRPKQLVYVGRLGPQKDLATLIRAMRRVTRDHADAVLTIVGGGPDEVKLKKIVTSLGLTSQVTFTGPVPYDQVMRHFAASTIFVISSLHEGTCMVLHEAGLAKKPIVATAFAGAVDLIESGIHGYVVAPRDAEALAEKISILLTDPSLAQQMGEACYEKVKQVGREYALDEWRQLCAHMRTVGN